MRTLTLNRADRERQYNREFIFIGSTPVDEDCTQAGANLEDMVIECKVLVNQLRRIYGQEHEGNEFFILENLHEFGIYYEAAIFYDQTEEEDYVFNFSSEPEQTLDIEPSPSETYAFKCEHLPEKWDSDALAELRKLGHTKYQPAKIIQMKAA